MQSGYTGQFTGKGRIFQPRCIFVSILRHPKLSLRSALLLCGNVAQYIGQLGVANA